LNLINPSLLWLLSGISIPILIHLLTRFRSTTIKFSTVNYIKELKTSSIKKIKIQQFILLLLRMMTIISLVLMFAQPVTKGIVPGLIVSEQKTRLVLVIDNSASMSSIKNGETLLDRAKKGAITLLPTFGENTKITIAQTCPQKILYTGKQQDSRLISSIENIKHTKEFDEVWHLIDSLVTDRKYDDPVKECIVFSNATHEPDSLFLSTNFSYDWKFYFINPGEVIENLAIESVSTINRIKTPTELIKINTIISNSSGFLKKNIPIELLFDQNRVGQVLAEFSANSDKEFIFQAYPGKKGIIDGSIVLPVDDYLEDNKWFFSMPIMKEIKCGIIGSNDEELTILKMLFRSIDPNNQFLSIETRLQPDINRLFIDEFDVVIIHNPQSISEESIEALDLYLKNGGGVIWFQGNNKEFFNGDLVDHLGFPYLNDIRKSKSGFFNVDYNMFNSDLLSNLQVRNLQNELPEIFSYIDVDITKRQKIHMSLGSADPLLLEFSKGSGKVFYFTTLLDLRWNDFPVRAILIPLIHRLLILTGTDEINTSPVIVGESKWISVPQDYIRNTWKVKSPSGIQTFILPDFNKEGIWISDTKELGIYQVYSNESLFTSFPTRLHHNEYIKDISFQSSINNFLSKDDIKWLNLEGDFASGFSETRNGKSLWKTFLLIGIILLLIESIVGRPNPSKMKIEKVDA